MQEYADKGSLADAIAAGRFRRKLDGSVDVVAILKCLNDVAAGACASPSVPCLVCHQLLAFKWA